MSQSGVPLGPLSVSCWAGVSVGVEEALELAEEVTVEVTVDL